VNFFLKINEVGHPQICATRFSLVSVLSVYPCIMQFKLLFLLTSQFLFLYFLSAQFSVIIATRNRFSDSVCNVRLLEVFWGVNESNCYLELLIGI